MPEFSAHFPIPRIDIYREPDMSSKWRVFATCLLIAAPGISHAQSPAARDSWLMQNYRFTGPPPPGSVRPTDPVVSELQRIQDAVTSIMRHAKSTEDYETALAAAAQASANAQLIGAVREHLEATAAAKASADAAKTSADEAKSEMPSPTYLIALQDHTVETATRLWSDGRMLHYLTRQGAHVQVRLDLVDIDLSARLNREINLEFRLTK